MEIIIRVADANDFHYAPAICELIKESAKIRGTGIAERKPEYVCTKFENGNAVIALCFISPSQIGRRTAHRVVTLHERAELHFGKRLTVQITPRFSTKITPSSNSKV